MPPRPWSTGCYTCRCRRVKCDEAKPECARCKKSGRLCTGYRTTDQPVFKSVFVSTSDALIPVPNTRVTPDITTLFPVKLAIQPSVDWEQCAIRRFLAHIVEPATEITSGFMEFLPEMMKWTFDGTHDALLAISFAHLANVSNNQEFLAKSKVHYGRALRSVQVALRDRESAATDTNLLNVVALQMYETIAGTLALDGTVSPHDKATPELIRLRRNTPQTSKASMRLSEMVKTRNEIQMLSTVSDKSEEHPTSSHTGASFRIHLRRVSTACAILQTTRIHASDCDPIHDVALARALSQAIEVHEEIAKWPSSIRIQWRYKPHIAPKDVAGYGIPQVFVFNSCQHGSMWMLYFCSGIHMCQEILETLDLLAERDNLIPTGVSFGQIKKDIFKSLIASVDNICSCAPFLLGDVDYEGHMNRSNTERKALGAFFLLRGLMVANDVEGLPLRQRQILINLLTRVGAQFGFREGHRLREAWMASHKAEAEQLHL